MLFGLGASQAMIPEMSPAFKEWQRIKIAGGGTKLVPPNNGAILHREAVAKVAKRAIEAAAKTKKTAQKAIPMVPIASLLGPTPGQTVNQDEDLTYAAAPVNQTSSAVPLAIAGAALLALLLFKGGLKL